MGHQYTLDANPTSDAVDTDGEYEIDNKRLSTLLRPW